MSVAVFVGPSLPAAEAAALSQARVEPPAARGDLLRLFEEGVRSFLLIDGVFAHHRAVAPGEVVAILRAGAQVSGAASLGALRAAECAPAGMRPIGAIARLYVLRVLRDDDEVAVAVEPDCGFRSASVALINVRFAVLLALRRGWLTRIEAARVLASARALHFSARTWPAVWAGARLRPEPPLAALCTGTDIKRRDAALAVAQLAREDALPAPPATLAGAARPRVRGAERHPGPDPWFGERPERVRRSLGRWLRASGRSGEDDAAAWERLLRTHDLEGELMRWHAVRAGAALANGAEGPPLAPWLAHARAELARRHGAASWGALEAAARSGAGSGPGAPLADLRRAATALALARRNLGSRRLPE